MAATATDRYLFNGYLNAAIQNLRPAVMGDYRLPLPVSIGMVALCPVCYIIIEE